MPLARRHLQALKERYDLYALIAAKIDCGSLEILDHIEESEYQNKSALETYRAAEKSLAKDKRRKLDAKGGGNGGSSLSTRIDLEYRAAV
jgi:hypothetical protein